MSGILIAAAHKSSGKTTITLGLCAALRKRGITVQPFKKGPDYIDPMWLGRAAARPCYNLDFNTMSAQEIEGYYRRHSETAQLSLVEGNMGLFDSIDVEGRNSNAALAARLQLPVILVVDVKGATRSVVPLILGFSHFDPEITIAGVILNNVAGSRHEQRLREVIGHYCDIPIVGVIHRDPALAIDERHLGLVPSNEEAEAEALLSAIGERIGSQVDLERLIELAGGLNEPIPSPQAPSPTPSLRIGIARDAAFGFYYPDDLEAFAAADAELVPVDMLRDTALPPLDGLFIGGGFPETQMAALEANTAMREAVREAIEGGLPCYAECGGLMYLCRTITWEGRRHAMVGVIDADIEMNPKPVGRGLMRLKPTSAHPWPGMDSESEQAVHEFHYSRMHQVPSGLTFAYEVTRGQGIDGQHDGIVYKNLLASYAHLRHLHGSPWVNRFIEFIRAQRDNNG